MPKKYKKFWQRLEKYLPPVRLVTLLFFLTLDIILGYHFSQEAEVFAPTPVRELAKKIGIDLPEPKTAYVIKPTPEINTEQLVSYINQQRQERDIEPLEISPKLSTTAELLLQTFSQDNYQIQEKDYSDKLEEHLKTVKYNYKEAVNTAVIGPLSNDEVIDSWQDSEMIDALTDEKFSQIGLGLTTPEIEGFQVGALVIVMGEPAPERSLNLGTQPNQSQAIPNAPLISDSEVFQALNQYRADHSLPGLLEDSRLCQYAEKRAQDLKTFGGLDAHQGFIADFNNPEPPVGIRDYPGGSVGENLASQFCINGTTGDSFVAETGTALIEWCFDSSVKGHREAQLNPSFNAACVRHADHLYVVIFGE